MRTIIIKLTAPTIATAPTILYIAVPFGPFVVTGGDGLTVGTGLDEGETVKVGFGEDETLGAGEGDEVSAGVGKGEGVGVGAAVGVGDAVGARVGVGVGAAVGVGDAVGAGVGVGVGAAVGVGDAVGAGVGVGGVNGEKTDKPDYHTNHLLPHQSCKQMMTPGTYTVHLLAPAEEAAK